MLERVGVTTARMQEVEQRMEQLPRRIKTTLYIPPRQLLLHCSTSCITHKDVGNADFAWSKNLSMQVVIPTFSLKGEGTGTYVDTYAQRKGALCRFISFVIYNRMRHYLKTTVRPHKSHHLLIPRRPTPHRLPVSRRVHSCV